MRVIIAGGREMSGSAAYRLVHLAILASGWGPLVTEVIHGAASGIDLAAGVYCGQVWPVRAVPADWAAHGRAAGPIRNRKMAEQADALIAIWNGFSRGTKNMIETAEEKGLRVYVYRYSSRLPD